MMQEGGGQDGGADPSHSGYAQQVDYFNICIVLLLQYCFSEALILKDNLLFKSSSSICRQMLVMRFLPDYAPFTIWSFNMPARAGDGRKLQLDKKFTCDTGMRLLCPSVSKPLRIWRKPQGMTIRMSPLCSIYLRLYTGILNSVHCSHME